MSVAGGGARFDRKPRRARGQTAISRNPAVRSNAVVCGGAPTTEVEFRVPSGDRSSADRLDSWKEIAAYLKRDVSTVQRWEKRESMPVHRHLHDKLGSVYAFQSELDAWCESRKAGADLSETIAPAEALPATEPSARFSRRVVAASIIATVVLLAAAAVLVARLRAIDYFWRNPLADAVFRPVTEFDGTEHSAAISRDGKLVAFLAARDGQVDVWITQTGTGRFHNVTTGRMPELVNPSVRTMGFSPDASLVSFWAARSDSSNKRQIGIWVAPTMAGEPRPFLDGVAEIEWSPDGRQLVYHTPAAGDPMFVKADGVTAGPIFTAPAPQHSHFPTWSPDQAFIYFVQGNVPDEMDIWRIRPAGGPAERITSHNSRVSHPTVLDGSTLLYLATADDGSGPWIYGMDVRRRVPHRLTHGVDRYTSLAASADGRRLIVTATHPRTSLWKMPLSSDPADVSPMTRLSVPAAHARLPRLAKDYLLYVSSNGVTDSLLKIANGTETELWSAPAARIAGGPAIAADDRIALSIEERGRTRLIVINANGTDARTVAASLEPRGSPAWSPDGESIVVAANERGAPRLFRVSVGTHAVAPLLDDYALDPTFAPHGEYLLYSGSDIGTTFPVKSITADGKPHAIPPLTLSRGARRFRFLPGQGGLVVLRGDIEHKNLWAIDLTTGAERQLTNFGRDVIIGDFDVSADGGEIVFERRQENSDVVLIERPAR
jgi:Tol biopolymer transport system component